MRKWDEETMRKREEITMRKRTETTRAYTKLYKNILEEKQSILVILKGQLLIENAVDSLLKSLLVDTSILNLDKKYLSQKIDLLIALGIITKDDAKPYRRLNDISRYYVNDIDYELSLEDVDSIVESLSEKHLEIASSFYKPLRYKENLFSEELIFERSETQEFLEVLNAIGKLRISIISLATLFIALNSEDDSFYVDPLFIEKLKEFNYLIEYDEYVKELGED